MEDQPPWEWTPTRQTMAKTSSLVWWTQESGQRVEASMINHGMTEIPSGWKGENENGIQFNSSMCNKKMIEAWFFRKCLIASYFNESISMNSTRDTDGHGTHTSTTTTENYVEGRLTSAMSHEPLAAWLPELVWPCSRPFGTWMVWHLTLLLQLIRISWMG